MHSINWASHIWHSHDLETINSLSQAILLYDDVKEITYIVTSSKFEISHPTSDQCTSFRSSCNWSCLGLSSIWLSLFQTLPYSLLKFLARLLHKASADITLRCSSRSTIESSSLEEQDPTASLMFHSMRLNVNSLSQHSI